MHRVERGGQVSYTFPLYITCKKGEGEQIACKILYILNGRPNTPSIFKTNGALGARLAPFSGWARLFIMYAPDVHMFFQPHIIPMILEECTDKALGS